MQGYGGAYKYAKYANVMGLGATASDATSNLLSHLITPMRLLGWQVLLFGSW